MQAQTFTLSPSRPPVRRCTHAEWALLAAVGLLAALAVCLPPLPLAEGYHQFADQRTLLGLPYAMDTLTNLAFAAAGLWGFAALHRARLTRAQAAVQPLAAAQRALAALFCAGLCVTALSSGYYHVTGPDDAGLFIDRLGMALAFAGMLGLAAADRISARAGLWLAAVVAPAAVSTAALHWQTGNMTAWTVLQTGGLALLAWLATRRPLPQALGLSLVGVIGFYAVAKGLELADAPVFVLTQQLISGHSAKHLVAALAVWPLVRALRRARPGPQSAG